MENLETIINATDIPEFIKSSIEKWTIEKDTPSYIYMLPDYGYIEPTIGQPFFLVIDKRNSKGSLIFRDTPGWETFNLNKLYDSE